MKLEYMRQGQWIEFGLLETEQTSDDSTDQERIMKLEPAVVAQGIRITINRNMSTNNVRQGRLNFDCDQFIIADEKDEPEARKLDEGLSKLKDLLKEKDELPDDDDETRKLESAMKQALKNTEMDVEQAF